MNDPIQGKRLVFIVGAPRSGTTWLQLMLGASSKVATVNETHLFSSYLTSLLRSWESFKLIKVRANGLHHFMTEQEFHGLIRTFAAHVMERILATKPDATVILEKTPNHMRYWREILATFPDACFLHLMRDPRAVVASLRAAQSGWASPWASPRLIDHCTAWSRSARRGTELAASTGNYLAVRYEDLHDRGGQSLQAIFAWIGIDASADECARIFDDYRIQNLRTQPPTTAPWDLAAEPAGFFRNGATESWRHDLSRSEIYLVEATTRELMTRFGYRPEADAGWFWRRAIVWRARLHQRARAALEWRVRRLADEFRLRP
jgi:hypothetical protein